MRYRALDSGGDYTFGRGPEEFLVDSPAAVVQAIQTALLLRQGEWFLDLNAGVPWDTQILGFRTASLYDAAIKFAITQTAGVLSILSYSSLLDRAKRVLTVTATVNTKFGEATIAMNLGQGYGVSPYGQSPYGDG